jgi:RNA polymerase sigma-70 factor (ECF subfamily)
LLVRVQGQDKAAWDRLVHVYAPLVYDWCHRHAGLQEADARDVGQEVFESVWRGIQGFRRDRPQDSFRAWLRVVTRNKIADFYRHRQPETVAEGGSEALTRVRQVPGMELPDPDPEMDSAETTLVYHRAVALMQSEFEEKTWQAFQAVVMNGQKPAEVARMLQMSIGAVYSAKSRILKRLREEFADLIDP